MYGIVFDCLFHFAPPHPPQEGAPKTRVWIGAPKPECDGGPQTRVCLGAPEGVKPALHVNTVASCRTSRPVSVLSTTGLAEQLL